MTVGEIIGTWLAAGLTLMMFSFIYRDNVFFKFGEHLYLGVSVGYFINIQYWQVIVPDLYREVVFEHHYLVIIPAILGIFILLRLVPSLSWLSRMSFALYIGGFAGLAIPNVIHNIFLVQLSQTLRPFSGGFLLVIIELVLVGVAAALLARAVQRGELWSGILCGVLVAVTIWLATWKHINGGDLNQIIILLAVFTVLIFFFFSLEHKKFIGGVSRVGLFFIMISFGASFGYTVMARISLLIGRFQFLIDDWIKGVILHIS